MTQERPSGSTASIEAAHALMSVGRYESAADMAREVLAQDPTSAEAHLVLAVCLVHLKEWALAEVELKEALRLDPSDRRAISVSVTVAVGLGRLDEAERSARTGVAVAPGSARARWDLARVLLERDRPAEALASAMEGLTLDPGDPALYNTQGLALAHLGRLHEARAALIRGLGLDPGSAVLQNNLGMVLFLLGEPDSALARYVEAARLEPTFSPAVANVTRMAPRGLGGPPADKNERKRWGTAARFQLVGWWWTRHPGRERAALIAVLVLLGFVIPLFWIWVPMCAFLELFTRRWRIVRRISYSPSRLLIWRLVEFTCLVLGLAVATVAITARAAGAAGACYLFCAVLTGPVMSTIASEGRERIVGAAVVGALLVSGVILIETTTTPSDLTISFVFYPYLFAICLIGAKFARIVRVLSFEGGLRSVRT